MDILSSQIDTNSSDFKENKEFRDLVQARRKDSGWHDDPENKI